jgi:hypothetical protein
MQKNADFIHMIGNGMINFYIVKIVEKTESFKQMYVEHYFTGGSHPYTARCSVEFGYPCAHVYCKLHETYGDNYTTIENFKCFECERHRKQKIPEIVQESREQRALEIVLIKGKEKINTKFVKKDKI